MPAPALVTIGDKLVPTKALFSEGNGLLFVIRPPQRRFKWKKQQVEQLWTDLRRARRTKLDSYFLGTLLLVPFDGGTMAHEGNWVSVIDGQQRITTLSILLAVLRDQCIKCDPNDPDLVGRANVLQRLISRVDNNDNPRHLVVTLQDADNPKFIRLVRERGSTLLPHGNDLLSEAVKNMTQCVKAHIKDKSNRKEMLLSLCDYVQDRINFLPLELQSESDGYLVFDTTNTRGMRLSASEALKARLVTIAARQDTNLSEELIRIWDAVAGKLESADLSIDAMDAYMHAILSAREGSKVKRNLDLGRDKLTETDEIRDLLEDIEGYCDSYLAVVRPSGSSSLCEDLKDLVSRLNVVQSNSFLTMIHKHSRDRFQESVSLVLSLQIRNITIGRFQANEYEQQWPKWAKLVRKGETEDAFQEIRGLIVSDEEFQEAFEMAEVSSAGTARHLLRRLDPISQPGSGVQPMHVDVEHILPKSRCIKTHRKQESHQQGQAVDNGP